MKHWPTNISTSAGSVATEAAAICARGVPGTPLARPCETRFAHLAAVVVAPSRQSRGAHAADAADPVRVSAAGREIFRESLTNEALETRVARMVAELEKAAQK